jgi:hypothetical protein
MIGWLTQLTESCPGLLWADTDSYHLSRNVRSRNTPWISEDGWLIIAIIVGGVLAALLLAKWMARHDTTRRIYSPRALFRQLCKAHNLDWSSRRLLKRIAQSHGLAHPARLFLEPQRFALESLAPELADRAEQIEYLREQLFGDLNDEPTPSVEPTVATNSIDPVAV